MAQTMAERESELNRLLAESAARHQREWEKETEALRHELYLISLCKPPAPVVLADGRVMTYTGPLPQWTPEGIKWPEMPKVEEAVE